MIRLMDPFLLKQKRKEKKRKEIVKRWLAGIQKLIGNSNNNGTAIL